MSNMSREEFLRLQKEAQTRMREMQKRSDEITGKMPPAPDFVTLRNKSKRPKNRSKTSVQTD